MKILINAIGTLPLFSREGCAIQKLVGLQIKSLVKAHEVTVVGRMAENRHGIRLIRCNRAPSVHTISRFLFYGIIDFFRILRADADVVISTHQRNFLSSFLFAKMMNKSFIAWEFDHIFWTPPITRVKKLYHFLMKHVTKVVAISSIQKERMIHFGISPHNISLIYNFEDTEMFSPAPAEAAAGSGSGDYILYVAKFTERKNQLNLLRAFKEVSDKGQFAGIKLRLVGPASGAYVSKEGVTTTYYRECMSYIRESGLEQKVEMYSAQGLEQLIQFYRQAAVFVIPSREEGFGLVLLEAMSCGCPCISNDIEPLTEVMGNAGLVVDAGDVTSLAHAMEQLLTDHELRKELGMRARERAVSVFSTNSLERNLEKLMGEIEGAAL